MHIYPTLGNRRVSTITARDIQLFLADLRAKPKPDGQPRRYADSILGGVRSFYLDIAAWAHEDPARWAEWAVPCPVSIRDVRGSHKRRAVLTHRMQARTRTLAPHLPTLAARAEQRYREYEKPLNADTSFWGDIAGWAREPLENEAAYRNYIAMLREVPA